MPATRYKVWTRGALVGHGVTDAFFVHVQGVAKAATPGLPYVVPNELICGRLASVLLLPIPPGFIIEHAARPHYVSLDFNLSGQGLPPADPAALMAAAPKIGAGILAFDAWVVNSDRHRRNLAFDTTTKRVQIFDHSHALYGEDGSNLVDHENDLGFERPHCLADELTSFDDIVNWCALICAIPRHYIKGLLNAAVDVGLPQSAVDMCLDFLMRRRERLVRLFQEGRAQFPKVTAKLWDVPSGPTYERKPRNLKNLRSGKGLTAALLRISEIGRRAGGD